MCVCVCVYACVCECVCVYVCEEKKTPMFGEKGGIQLNQCYLDYLVTLNEFTFTYKFEMKYGQLIRFIKRGSYWLLPEEIDI